MNIIGKENRNKIEIGRPTLDSNSVLISVCT